MHHFSHIGDMFLNDVRILFCSLSCEQMDSFSPILYMHQVGIVTCHFLPICNSYDPWLMSVLRFRTLSLKGMDRILPNFVYTLFRITKMNIPVSPSSSATGSYPYSRVKPDQPVEDDPYWKSDVSVLPGLQIKMHTLKLFCLIINQNICCGYSKEPSRWDRSFEHPHHMFKLIDKEINTNFKGCLSGPMNT